MNEIKKLSNSFEETLKDSNLQNVSIGILEVLTDSILEEGITKDIPIIGTIVGLGKTTMNIKDSLFLKKIIHFITEVKNINPDLRNKMISEIDESKKFRIKVGEKLLYIIDKSEDHISTQNIAKLFTAFLVGDLTYSEFLRGSSILQKVFIEDLEYFLSDKTELEKERELDEYFSDIEANLINVGLCSTNTESISVRDQDDWKMSNKYIIEGGRTVLYLTEIGKKIESILKKTNANSK